jgi:hypothetical protein
MKKILTIISLFVATNANSQNWQDKIAKRFYSTIDSSKKLECCDSHSPVLSINYVISTYELPYNSASEVLERYENDVIDSLYIQDVVDELVKSYKKLPKRIKSKITRSCYGIETTTQITRNLESDLVWAEGKISMTINFQTNENYKRSWFKRLFGIL